MDFRGSRKELFCKRVVELRERRELTQAELGRQAGVSGTCVWNWERGNTYPRPGTMKRLAQALGTSPAFLSGNESNVISTEGQPVGRPLAEIIAHAREMVASAAGVPLSKVRVVLDVGD